MLNDLTFLCWYFLTSRWILKLLEKWNAWNIFSHRVILSTKVNTNVLRIFVGSITHPSITKSILVVIFWRNVIELFVNKRQFSFLWKVYCFISERQLFYLLLDKEIKGSKDVKGRVYIRVGKIMKKPLLAFLLKRSILDTTVFTRNISIV